jgi:hypothetical protein
MKNKSFFDCNLSLFFYSDFVEVNNGYVSICKEAILGNCSKSECKFTIYVPKNFNGKYFTSIIIKAGVRTLPVLSQQQLAHISHFLLFIFLFLYIYLMTST